MPFPNPEHVRNNDLRSREQIIDLKKLEVDTKNPGMVASALHLLSQVIGKREEMVNPRDQLRNG
jgi:hypothetical protein